MPGTTMKTTVVVCPECGKHEKSPSDRPIGFDPNIHYFMCGSAAPHGDLQGLDQSKRCQITALERKVAELLTDLALEQGAKRMLRKLYDLVTEERNKLREKVATYEHAREKIDGPPPAGQD